MIIGRYTHQIYDILIHSIDAHIFATMYKGPDFHHRDNWTLAESTAADFAIADARRRPWTLGNPITPRVLPIQPNHPESGCQMPDHKGTRRIDVHSHYIYTSLEHGITERVCCRACYARHILRYFPDSTVAAHIRKNRRDSHYVNTYQTKRK